MPQQYADPLTVRAHESETQATTVAKVRWTVKGVLVAPVSAVAVAANV